MDTLASLALATESPGPTLLYRMPHDKKEYIVSKKMFKFIYGHSLYQIFVILLLTFGADVFIPEFGADIRAADGTSVRYSSNGKYMRSGRYYYVNKDAEDYLPYLVDYGPSRHFTLVFNTFVMMQILNFFNSRKLNDELNIFEGLTRAPVFCLIVVLIVGLQIIIGRFGNKPLNISYDGMNILHWLIGLGFALGEWVIGFILKFIPETKCCQAGNSMSDPINQTSSILNIKRPSSKRALERKYTPTLMTAGRGKSMTTLQQIVNRA
mmetsp:Transcript_28838/g.33306  ORF Transcript_28838/g.33306 Transcript_28838/m.33306 type:complete len:266 (-) Transcript_28838:30-827(-)